MSWKVSQVTAPDKLPCLIRPDITFKTAVFLLGTSPTNINPNFQGGDSRNHYLVVHAHIAPGGTFQNTGQMAIGQINLRHARRIMNQETATIPGRFRVSQDEGNGRWCIQCPTGTFHTHMTGVNPARQIAGNMNLQTELVLRLIHTMRGWGTNGDLFNLNDPRGPDDSHLWRIETGWRTGDLVSTTGQPMSMFNPQTGRYFDGRGSQGVAFDSEGRQYYPPSDIMNTPGFYSS